MSINSLFGSARLALQAQQIAMETASHNIANANVEGFSRQVVSLTPNLPNYTPQGAVGTGVIVQDISRVRDTLLDVNYRTQTSLASGSAARNDALQQIGDMFGEPSDTGLAATLDAFYNAWSDLANSPTSSAAQSVVQQRGAQVASTLNRFSSTLDTIASNTLGTATQQVADLNRYLAQVATLNKQIVAAEAGGQTASDLRDQRDVALDALAKIAPVRVIEQPNGATTVYVGSMQAVDGSDARQFSLQRSGNVTSLVTGNQVVASPSLGGALGANLAVLNTDIPNARQQLDTLAAGIVSTVNAIHRTGWTAAGDALGNANWDASAPPTGSNVDFFDPSKTTAATISLSAQVASSAAYIAAGNVQNGSGNTAVANALGGLRSDATAITKFGGIGTTSLSGFYQDLVARVGTATNDADASATVYQTLARQADTQRQSVSGVSTDDELIEITKRQQAYSAAAKVITTATQMSQTLLDMLG
jgi:flagellar hook-associated protein 1 FlgK